MTSWGGFTRAEPEFAAPVRAILDDHVQKILATLRADGSPRVSGIEVAFEGDDAVLGSMPGARKGADLRRNPRCALHSVPRVPMDAADSPGEVRLDGRAVAAGAVTGPHPGDRFVLDVDRVTRVAVDRARELLVIDWWTAREGRRRIERA